MNIPLYARNFEDRLQYKTKLEIWYNKEREIVDIPFKPYFYSRTARKISVADVEMERWKFISDLHSETLYKYNFNSVKDIPLYRDESSLECDIPYLQRVAIDEPSFYTKFPQTKPLDIMYFDIETDVSESLFPRPKRNIIVAISYALNDDDLITYTVKDISEGDANILQRFMYDIKKIDPDVMVGYNCVIGSTELILDDGSIVCIQDYVNQGKLLPVVGYNNIIVPCQVSKTWKYEKGKHKILRLTTRSGRVISLTPDNKVLYGGDEIKWIVSRELKRGDLIAVPNVINLHEKEQYFIDCLDGNRRVSDKQYISRLFDELRKTLGVKYIAKYSDGDKIQYWGWEQWVCKILGLNPCNFHGCRQRGRLKISYIKRLLPIIGRDWEKDKLNIKEVEGFKLPELSPDLFYIMGLIATDGTMPEGPGQQLKLYNTDWKILDAFEQKVRSIVPVHNMIKKGIVPVHIIKVKLRCNTKYSQLYSLAFSCSIIWDFARYIGLPFGNRMQKSYRLTNLLRFNKRFIGAFLAGYYDGDGSKGYQYTIGIKKDIIKRDIQLLFTRLGIITGIKSSGVSIYSLLNNQKNIDKYVNPYIKTVKINRGQKHGCYDTLPRKYVLNFHEMRYKYGLRLSDFSMSRGTMAYIEEGRQPLTCMVFDKILKDFANKGIDVSKLRSEVFDSDLFWDKIISIGEYEVDVVYDLTTDCSNFVANNILVHNCLNFDFPYIIDRLRINGMSDESLSRNRGGASFINQEGQTIMNVQGRALFDVYDEVRKDFSLFGISSRGLKEVGKWFNVEKKLHEDERYRDYKVILEYAGDMRSLIGTERLKNYVESDVLITRELSKFYFRNIVTFAEMLKTPISLMARKTANLIGTIVYARELRKKKIISDAPNFKRFPSIFGTPAFIERKGKYIFEGGSGIQGALVGLYKNGKSLPLFTELKEQYDNIWKLDFTAMYPSIQRTFGLSPETTKIFSVEKLTSKHKLTYEKKDDYAILGIPDKKMGYVTIRINNEGGFLPQMLTELQSKRDEVRTRLKDKTIPKHEIETLESLSYAIKIQMVMNYGINGSSYFRYGDVAVTIATTGLGRHFMELVLNVSPLNNIACDTDGVYLKSKPDLKMYNKVINDYIEKMFGIKSFMQLDMEGPFPKAYFLKRKNYLLMKEDSTIIKHGASFKGSSKNILYRYALERLVKTMFDEPHKMKEAIKDCFKLDERDIKSFIQRTSINRPVADYESGGCLQVQIAKQLAKFHDIEIEIGDSIEYVKQEAGYVIKDLAKLRKIDKKYYVRQVENVLKQLNLTQTSVHISKGFKHNRYKRGKSGYVYESDGRISRQLSLNEV